MKKVTLEQRDRFWRAVERREIPREQFNDALASELLFDVLEANFNELQPIDRWEIRNLLGLKPLASLSSELSAWKLYESCADTRLKRVIEGWIQERSHRNQEKTIEDFCDAIEQSPLCRWKKVGGKAILGLVDLLMEKFGIDVTLTPEDHERIKQYRLRSAAIATSTLAILGA